MPLEPGTRLGPYEVVGLIGQGGMGEVYQARDTKLDRDVALKVLPEAFTSDPDRIGWPASSVRPRCWPRHRLLRTQAFVGDAVTCAC